MRPRLTGAFAVIALMPAGLNVAAWGSPVIPVSLCGEGRTEEIWAKLEPIAPSDHPNEDHACPKGCHAGGSRKRGHYERPVPDLTEPYG